MRRQVIMFDESHSELLQLDRVQRDKDWDSWTRLKKLMDSLHYKVIKNTTEPITDEILKNVDILVLGCPRTPFSESEITSIVSFVENGGSLFLMSNYGGDMRNNTNLSAISRNFGIEFCNDQIFDPEQNIAGYKYGVIISDLSDSPICFNVPEFYYLIGCSLKVSKNARTIARSSQSSYHKIYEKGETWKKDSTARLPVIAAVETENKGRIVAIGEFNLFSDDDFGLIMPSNKKLFINIINWLLEPKLQLEQRIELQELKLVEISREIAELKRIFSIATVEKDGKKTLYSPEQLALKVSRIEASIDSDSEEMKELEKFYYRKRVRYEFYAIIISAISIVIVFISLIFSILT
ncbi:MAG: Gldg family protein [Candidatus Helarchaeales archaeon]